MQAKPAANLSRELVDVERMKQDEKWGEQNHSDEIWLAIILEEIGETSQAILHTRFGGKQSGRTEEELIHVTSVALAWLECKIRNK